MDDPLPDDDYVTPFLHGLEEIADEVEALKAAGKPHSVEAALDSIRNRETAKRKAKPGTDAGKAFADETRGVVRSLAARKGVGTRRKNKAAEHEAFLRDHFFVLRLNESVTFFERDRYSLTEVVSQLTEHFGADIDNEGRFYGDGDLTVWLERRLVAVVRGGPDGKPVITRFD